MQKVLITGVNGFVGQHLINILDKYFIIGLTHGGELNDTSNQKFHSGNILDSHFLEEIINKYKPEYIIHLAAIAPTNFKDAEPIFKINLLGTNNLYQAVIKHQSNTYNPKILYISSAEVYGKTDNPENITEDSNLKPLNYYGTSKLAADRLSFQLSVSHKLNTVIIRPFNHSGPGQGLGFFVPDVCSQIVEIEKNHRDPQISVGNLDSMRDISDVRDIVNGYKLLMENDTDAGEVFNLCSGKGIKMQDLLEKLLKLSTKDIKITSDPEKIRLSDNPISVGSHSKITSLFGWEPKYNLDQTLTDALEYWRNKNP
jgi:GDP-4-dehydro-6-deoxy-D-mannose reductase